MTSEGKNSQTYENELIELINDFLSKLTEEQFNSIKNQLPALFNVNSVSAE